MDSTPFKEKIPSFLKLMKERNYSITRYSMYKVECQRILDTIDAFPDIDSYVDNLYRIIESGESAWKRVVSVRVIYNYVFKDIIPERTLKKALNPLSTYYAELLDYGVNVARKDGKHTKTCQNYIDTMTTFFRHLENHNIYNISQIEEGVIWSYFNGAKKRGHTTSRLIIRFLGLIKDFVGIEEIQRIDSLIPRVQKVHKVYNGLSSAERDAIERVILENHSGVSLRDRAICALTFYTGMRSCDIINLRFNNIDWKRNLISIVQVKTGKDLALPLLPCFGNLIYDYITQERSRDVKDNHIFLRGSLTPMTTHDTYKSTIEIMHAAGITGQRANHGIHLLRHSLATAMIVKNTNFAIITATLGHKSARATYTYIDSETNGLRQCALDVTKFPINQAIFE